MDIGFVKESIMEALQDDEDIDGVEELDKPRESSRKIQVTTMDGDIYVVTIDTLEAV